MKIVVIGGSGLIGNTVVENLRQQAHEVVAASPSSGVNAVTGEGLARALAGARVVVDAACLGKAEAKYLSEFAKAEATGGCEVTDDDAPIKTKVDAGVDDVVSDLGCGNSVTEGDEACDDGNLTNGDGCSSECEYEGDSVCGDAVISAGESCDDGGNAAGDGCSATCTIEAGWDCAGEPSDCTPL